MLVISLLNIMQRNIWSLVIIVLISQTISIIVWLIVTRHTILVALYQTIHSLVHVERCIFSIIANSQSWVHIKQNIINTEFSWPVRSLHLQLYNLPNSFSVNLFLYFFWVKLSKYLEGDVVNWNCNFSRRLQCNPKRRVNERKHIRSPVSKIRNSGKY